ncbi:substrate-binding domain-containing protein [Candidatus Poseidoniales archaeon]|nr:substrate-binding domain-containing protein [Candidatus Poseidoniales archaeon]
MKRVFFLLFVFILPCLQGCLGTSEEVSGQTIRLATTTSMRDSGLLAELLPAFTSETGIEVDVIAVGSGAAMNLAKTNDVDVLISHSPSNEILFVEEGHAINRTTFAWNRFVLIGPYQLSGNLTEAMSSLVRENKCFISRGDSSGTHIKEQDVWRNVAESNNHSFIDNELGYHPDWEGYQSIGQGMGAAITIANELECWTLSDKGTALFRSNNIQLSIQEFESQELVNPYSVLLLDNDRLSETTLFREFLLNNADLIDNYTVSNETLFESGLPLNYN